MQKPRRSLAGSQQEPKRHPQQSLQKPMIAQLQRTLERQRRPHVQLSLERQRRPHARSGILTQVSLAFDVKDVGHQVDPIDLPIDMGVDMQHATNTVRRTPTVAHTFAQGLALAKNCLG